MRQKCAAEGTARSAVGMVRWAVVMCAAMVLCGAGGACAPKAKSAKEKKAAEIATVKGDPSKNYTEDLGGGVALEMVWIPAGKFLMGGRLTAKEVVKKYGGQPGDEEYYQNERPLHTVELDGFWIGKFEVTNAQLRKFRPDHSSGEWQGRDLNGDKQPVVRVTWNDAKAFCEWLSEKTGETYSLPTEAQWEYACRAGTKTERYWGDDDETMGQYANVCDQTALEPIKKFLGKFIIQWREWMAAKTTDGYVVAGPVGSFLPNKFGLYDMIGNVWEWCADWYGEKYYTDSPGRNPMGPASGQYRVLRGGGWDNNPKYCRSANRYRLDPDLRLDAGGFRVVRTQK